MNLREIGEGALIRKIREKFDSKEGVTVGIGDDAAVFDLPSGYSAVFCSDLVAENTHFIRNLHPPDSIGYKAVAVNVSDVGAMGGMPMHFLISFAAPGDLDVTWVDAFLDGVERACTDFGVSLLGGDSSSSDRIFVDVSMIGRVRTGGGGAPFRRKSGRRYLRHGNSWADQRWGLELFEGRAIRRMQPLNAIFIRNPGIASALR